MKLCAMVAAAAAMLAFASPASAFENIPDAPATATVVCPDGTTPTAVPDAGAVLPLLQCGEHVFGHPGVYAADRDSVCNDGQLPVTQVVAFHEHGVELKDGVCRSGARLTTFSAMTDAVDGLSHADLERLHRSMSTVTALLEIEVAGKQ